jgi:hypothetical protein
VDAQLLRVLVMFLSASSVCMDLPKNDRGMSSYFLPGFYGWKRAHELLKQMLTAS